jgi:hypothetical protein
MKTMVSLGVIAALLALCTTLAAPAQASGGTINAVQEIITEQGAPPFWVAVGSSSGSWAGIYTVKPNIGPITTSGLYETVPTDTGALDAIFCSWNPSGNGGNGSDSCILAGVGSGSTGDVVTVNFWLNGGVSGYGPPWGTPWYAPPTYWTAPGDPTLTRFSGGLDSVLATGTNTLNVLLSNTKNAKHAKPGTTHKTIAGLTAVTIVTTKTTIKTFTYPGQIETVVTTNLGKTWTVEW